MCFPARGLKTLDQFPPYGLLKTCLSIISDLSLGYSTPYILKYPSPYFWVHEGIHRSGINHLYDQLLLHHHCCTRGWFAARWLKIHVPPLREEAELFSYSPHDYKFSRGHFKWKICVTREEDSKEGESWLLLYRSSNGPTLKGSKDVGRVFLWRSREVLGTSLVELQRSNDVMVPIRIINQTRLTMDNSAYIFILERIPRTKKTLRERYTIETTIRALSYGGDTRLVRRGKEGKIAFLSWL